MLTRHGYPIRLYHGTCAEFEVFRPLSHFGTRRAAEQIQKKLHISVDGFNNDSLETKALQATLQAMNILSNVKKGIPNKKDLTPKIIPVYLHLNNPLVLPDIGAHSIANYKNIIFRMLIYRQYGGNPPLCTDCSENGSNYYLNMLKIFTEVCQSANFMSEIRFIFNHPFECPYANVKRELSLGGLYPIVTEPEHGRSPEEINRTHLAAQRMIRFFEEQGFDGIQYINEKEDAGSVSYVIFRPEQVVRLDRYPPVSTLAPYPRDDETLKKIQEETLPQVKPTPFSEREVELFYFFELELTKGKNESFLLHSIERPQASYVTTKTLLIKPSNGGNEKC